MSKHETFEQPVAVVKRRGVRRHITWLSLCLMSFMALMVLIMYEARWVYPEIQTYFSQTGSLTGQQLATRSRNYLQRAQQTLLNEQRFEEEHTAFVVLNLDLAYGLMDVDIYHRHYACTAPSLAALDSLSLRLDSGRVPPFVAARELLEPIDCLTHIEMSQLDRRGKAINDFSESTRRHNDVLTYSSMIIFAVGLLFWAMHERQLRRTERATAQTLAWMQRAMRDPLTGIGNRSALHRDVMVSADESLGLILVDIDYFKQYNDALGHPEGDQLLRRLANLLKEQLGEDVMLYRLGGDEFAAVFSCPNDQALIDYCNQLIDGLRRSAFKHPAHPDNKNVTLSVGATRFAVMETTFARAYEAADKALYQVKAAGRDGWQMTASL